MAKDLVLDVIAKKNSKELSHLADEFDRLSKKVDDSGKSMQQHATFSKYLDDQLAKTKVQVKQLGEEFDKTGKADVFASLKGAERNLKSLERIKKDLTNAVGTGIKEGAQQGSKSFGDVLQALPAQAKAAVVGVVVGGLIVGAPAIGAAVSGAILAGVGGAGVAAGIAGQIHNPLVTKALDGLKSDLSAGFTQATSAFAPVLLQGIADFDKGFQRFEPRLEAAFNRLAGPAGKLIDGLEQFGAKAAPGFLEALDAAGPILVQTGHDLGQLGQSFGVFFHDVSGGAAGAKDGLHDLFIIVEGTVEGTGKLLEGLSKGFVLLEATGDLMKGNVGSAVARVGELATNSHAGADATKDLAGRLKQAATDAASAAAALEKVNGALADLISKQLALDNSNNAFHEGLLTLKGDLDKNTHGLDEHTLAGLKNEDVYRRLIEKAAQARQAAIDHAGGVNASKTAVDAANASYEKAITDLVNAGVQAGTTRAALEKLAGQYDVRVLLAIQSINTSGLGQNVAPHDVARFGSAGPPKRAAGGPVLLGHEYTVNEAGIERFTPWADGWVSPHGAPPPAGGGFGGATNITINLTVTAGLGTNGQQVGQQILAVLRPAIAAEGGVVQRVLGPPGKN